MSTAPAFCHLPSLPGRDALLPPRPQFALPGLPDVLVLVGMPALAVLACPLLLRVLPELSLWEVRAAERLVFRRTTHEADVVVVARPS